MNKIAIAVHGGASEVTTFLKEHIKEYEAGLAKATEAGYQVLENRGSALDAVEVAVRILEDDPLFNAGCGSALNNAGEVEMDASIMDGATLDAGAASMVKNVKNPISLARYIMVHTNHVFLSGYGASKVANLAKLPLEPDQYFITESQQKYFESLVQKESLQQILNKKSYGTVGAVALDSQGNLASATSTGGTTNSLPGRIGDSCIIGAGCYANNNSCAVSGTGVGEFLIRDVVAHTIAIMVEFKMSLQEACDYVIHKRNRHPDGEMGVISVNKNAEIAMAFNTEIMKRAWKTSDEVLQVKIFK
jgi:beta-aspartyl-peptidase (threonine type)